MKNNLAVNNKQNNTKPVTPTPKPGSTNSNTVKKSAKGQVVQQVEEEIKPPPPKIKNIERFIYVTTYNDIETMKTLKELFESINKEAFNLKSIKEVYTKTLTPEEEEDNNIDYISGFQLLDTNIRITIIEGITGKAMKIVKERLPKLNLNSSSNKVYSDSRILFDTRIYSKFNLCMKFIKLRDSLNNILITFDIYLKAGKYKEIYDAFMNLGSILQSQTLQEIADANLFPPAESMLLLERKYADILNDEDLTGVKIPKKIKKKRLRAESLDRGGSIHNTGVTSTSAYMTENSALGNSLNNTAVSISKINTGNVSRLSSNIKSKSQSQFVKNTNSKMNINNSGQIQVNLNDNPPVQMAKPKLDSHNYEFLKHKEAQIFRNYNPHQNNLEIIKNLNSKANSNLFCGRKKHDTEYVKEKEEINLNLKQEINKNEDEMEILKNSSFLNKNNNSITPDDKVYMYSQQRKNYYADYFDQLRVKLSHDKNNFYTYSKDYLTLSFPMIKNSNLKYDEYLENKKKWIDPNGKNFNLYEQPKRESYFFPKIKNEL